MQKTVFALHTSFVLIEPLGKLFAELLSGVRIVNVVDDSLLADVRTAGRLIPSVTRRIISYGLLAQSAGADAIFNCCSSVGDAAEMLAEAVDIPVVRIDGRIAELAVSYGPRIGVVATVATTLHPTAALIARNATNAAKQIEINTYLVDGAFDVLVCGDPERHDRMVTAELQRAAGENDVVVLAQASMARLIPGLQTSVPVLSSPRLGIEALKQSLFPGSGLC